MSCWTFFVLAVVGVIQTDACPWGMDYVKDFDSCYKKVPDAMTWEDARAHCGTSVPGGHLIEVTSEAKQKFVEAEMAGAHVWLGGHRLPNGGVNEFDWPHSGASLDSYDNWSPGEPDNRNFDPSMPNPDCIIGLHDNGYRWFDRSCEFQAAFICEKYKCPSGMAYNFQLNACYKMVTDVQNWDDANAYCERLGQGSHLIEVTDQARQDFVTEVMAGSHVWLGGRRLPNGGVNDLTWSYSGKQLDYSNWESNQPDNINYDTSIPNPDCIIALEDHAHLWFDRACVFEAAFICERNV